jgi:hypothetical protein
MQIVDGMDHNVLIGDVLLWPLLIQQQHNVRQHMLVIIVFQPIQSMEQLPVV